MSKLFSWYSTAIELEPERSPMYTQPKEIKEMTLFLLFFHVAETTAIIP
jgi:hypothetical protein